MVINNYTKQQVSYALAGQGFTAPAYFMLGSGSGTALATQTTLIAAVDRQAITSTNSGTAFKTTWQGDWTSIEMSGIQLTEFGLIISGGGLTGSLYSRASIPSLTFDGTNELQIQECWEVF